MSDIPEKPEQRHYKRVNEELPVQLQVDGRAIESTTENISCGGMFLPSVSNDFKEDKTLVAFVTLPEAMKTVRLTGRVSRVLTGTTPGECGVAIQFNGLFDDNHLEIDRYVKWKLLN